MNHRLADDIHDSFHGLECSKVGLAYGSLVYFDFGRKLIAPIAKGRIGEFGEASIWLLGDDWAIERKAHLIVGSESVDRATMGLNVSGRLVGREVEGIFPGRTSITIDFGSNISVIVWRPGDAGIGVDEDLVRFFLPDGRIACFSESRGLFLSDEVDRIRRAAGRASTTDE